MTKNKSKKKTAKTILIVLISLILVALVVVGLLLLLNGKTTTSGTKHQNEKSASLICNGTNIDYPKLQKYKNPATETRVTIIFGYDTLASIGLLYTMTYTNESEAESAKTVLTSSLGSEVGKSGLGHSAMNNKFNSRENYLTLNLFSKTDELNDKTAPYYLINTSSKQLSNWTIEDYTKNYQAQGFSCKES